MSGQDLSIQLLDTEKRLHIALGELGKYGREHAQAEEKYRVALAQKILMERDKGVPVTIISDICRGDRTIARMKLERSVAEVMYTVTLERIQAYKLSMRMLDAQIQREWGR